MSIVSINGEEDPSKLSPMIMNMRAGDSAALRKYIRSIEPGVSMVQESTCPSCQETSEVNMPLEASFFLPDFG